MQKNLKIGIFGPHANELVRSLEGKFQQAREQAILIIPIESGASWGKASTDLVKAVYEEHVVALVALDRASSHLAEQIAVKSFIPVIAISSDRALTSTNIPWIFRLPDKITLNQALDCLSAAIERAGPTAPSSRGSGLWRIHRRRSVHFERRSPSVAGESSSRGISSEISPSLFSRNSLPVAPQSGSKFVQSMHFLIPWSKGNPVPVNTTQVQRVRVIDSHTGGEPTRLVVSGGPDLGKGSLAERLRRFRDEHDRLSLGGRERAARL